MVVTRWTRLAAALAVVAVSVALPFARTPSGPARRVPARIEPVAMTASFSSLGLSFRYPATWHSLIPSGEVSSFVAVIVYLSSSPLHDSCSVTTSSGGTSAACTGPISSVAPGGVLIQWDDDGFPNAGVPKPNTTVAGRPAVETRTSGGWCASLGGTETITVMIPRTVPDNWYQMEACLRPPNLPQQEADISAMLRTVQLPAGN
jgi:hypothetical protein